MVLTVLVFILPFLSLLLHTSQNPGGTSKISKEAGMLTPAMFASLTVYHCHVFVDSYGVVSERFTGAILPGSGSLW